MSAEKIVQAFVDSLLRTATSRAAIEDSFVRVLRDDKLPAPARKAVANAVWASEPESSVLGTVAGIYIGR